MTLRNVFCRVCLLAAVASGQARLPASSIELGANLPPRPIGGGDLLSISVYGSPELSRTARVSEEGLIRLPMLRSPIEARGAAPAELERRVSAALGEAGILVDPSVVITIAEYATHPIRVAGAVRHPLTFEATGPVTLLEALTRAEGLSGEAGGEILVTRAGTGPDTVPFTRRIAVKDLIDTAEPAANVILDGGEEVRVTRPPNTFSIQPPYGHMLLESLPLLVAVKIVVFRAFGLRDVAWRDIGFADLLRIGAANAGASGVTAVVLRLALGPAFPRSLLVLDFFVCLTLMVALRAAVKSLLEWRRVESPKTARRTLIYGAGRTGVATLAEIRAHASIGCQVIGFLDDDASKRSMRAHGVRVLGGRAELRAVVRKYRVGEVLLALPTASGDQLTGIMEQCQAAGVSVKRVPALLERIGPRVLVKQIREVRLEDLLGRPPARWEENGLPEHLSGRTVLVTGAGGSIGSELCRQIARHRPKTLIGFDQSEAGLYQVEQELREWFPSLEFRPAMGSIQNRRRLAELFQEHRPQSVYHAAAYKHVPLMESHLFEAVENNVLGTRNVARVASEHRAEEFVLVSSDKAVRPAGVMGATKRVAEMICQAERSDATRFLAVRFGNVLGSSGSVIPHFRRQIEAGGPVTVTHPDMRRYFMTIPEAAELVLQAATLGSGGEIFVLEMGEPVRILDLARKMVVLSGLRPDIDIPIVFSGTRPGEKLYEEVSALEENTSITPHAQIRVFSGPAPPPAVLWMILAEMERATQERDPAQVVSCLQKMVPGYTPSGVALREAQVPRTQAVGV